jgi:hypothetical protein
MPPAANVKGANDECYDPAMHPRSLLRQLTRTPLEKPCDSPWESMRGTDKVRHCASCERDVYSLSDMTELEAELRLLNAADAVPCIRYARDSDGEVMHLPPPMRRAWLPGASARALVAATALGLGAHDAAAQNKQKERAKEPVQCVMLNEETPPAPPAAPGTAALAPDVAQKPIPLAGAAPPPRQPIAYGTLSIRSKEPRDVEIQGIKLKAPVASFRMTPGDFVAEVRQEGKKKRTVKFTIKLDQQTVVDLDKR